MNTWWVVGGVVSMLAIGGIVLAVVLTRKSAATTQKDDSPTKWFTCDGAIRDWSQYATSSGNDLQSTAVNCRNNPGCKGWMKNQNGKTFYFLYKTPDSIECMPGAGWTTYLKT